MKQCIRISVIYVFLTAGLGSTVFAQEKTSSIETSEAVEMLIEQKKKVNKKVFNAQYYAIQLYYGNNTAAERILTAFREVYPDWEAELSFETPNYKVRVGRFKDLNIANQKLEEIRKEYRSDFLLEPYNL